MPMGGRKNPKLNPTVVSVFQQAFYKSNRIDDIWYWNYFASDDSMEFMRSGSDWKSNISRVEYTIHNRSDPTNKTVLTLDFNKYGWYIQQTSKTLPTCGLMYNYRPSLFKFIRSLNGALY